MPEKEDNEFELVPLSPIRRLEKRIDKIESNEEGVDIKGFFFELISIIRMNQEIVDELAKSNDALRIELSKLPAKIDEVTGNISELINYIKSAGIEESTQLSPETFKPLSEKLDELIETKKKVVENNQNISGLLESIEKKFRPSLPPRAPVLRPIQR